MEPHRAQNSQNYFGKVEYYGISYLLLYNQLYTLTISKFTTKILQNSMVLAWRQAYRPMEWRVQKETPRYMVTRDLTVSFPLHSMLKPYDFIVNKSYCQSFKDVIEVKLGQKNRALIS